MFPAGIEESAPTAGTRSVAHASTTPDSPQRTYLFSTWDDYNEISRRISEKLDGISGTE
jgi:hypothetical protein